MRGVNSRGIDENKDTAVLEMMFNGARNISGKHQTAKPRPKTVEVMSLPNTALANDLDSRQAIQRLRRATNKVATMTPIKANISSPEMNMLASFKEISRAGFYGGGLQRYCATCDFANEI